MTTRVSFQSRAKTELLFDGDVGNLLQQNQTSAEQPDPPDSLVNPPVCSNRKHSPLAEKRKIRNTRASDGGTHVKTWFDEVILFSFVLSSPLAASTPPTPTFPEATCEVSVKGEMCPSAVNPSKWSFRGSEGLREGAMEELQCYGVAMKLDYLFTPLWKGAGIHDKEGNREGCCLTGCVWADRRDNSHHNSLHVQCSYQRSIQGLTLGFLCTQWPLWERKRWELPPLALFDGTRLTRRACSKGSQEKNKYVLRPLLTSRHMPLPCQPHTQWSESQCAVSLRPRAQMRLTNDDYLHKSPRHPDEQLRLKLEIEFNIHSQQFPECCLSDLQYVQHKVEVTEL